MRRVLLLLGKFIPQDCRYRFTTAEDASGPLQETQLDNLDNGSFPVGTGHLVPDLGKICI